MGGSTGAGIAVIGLGAIGKAVAGHLENGGAVVSCFDPLGVPDHLQRAGSASPAASGADFVFICVPDGDAMRDVVNEMGPSVEGSLVIDMTTTAAHDKSWAAAAVQAAGGDFIEALIFGSKDEADAADLLLAVGGSNEAIDRAEPWLALISRQRFPAGPVGCATALKLAGTVLSAGMVQLLSESIGLASALGADPAQLMEIVHVAGFRSPIYDHKGRLMLAGDFTPRGRLGIALKDVRLIGRAADAAGMSLPVMSAVETAWTAGEDVGL